MKKKITKAAVKKITASRVATISLNNHKIEVLDVNGRVRVALGNISS